ncbi:AAA family ATPase [Rhodobacteraceae bacterium 2CG4]|uniref:DNA 3'-5' helicase n=1 Tax=Halovulum marinum TaxID=2662447 RepID=A0A6L5Z2B9_9RHOB|nr:ATP-dependent helicase [Halovulum marinum]MSU90225.1 AAA family ATPase [Halovulum marinum]
MAWFDGLTPGTPAHSIASTTNTRVRVVAGPGTGKSFAMKRRVARLLEAGVAPDLILPVTFTRVAAQDLHRELVNMGVPGCNALHAHTLHSLALRMLTRNHVLAATGRIPRPLNDFETEALVCDLMAAHGGKKAVDGLKQAYEAAWARLNHQTPGYAPSAAEAAFQHDLLEWLRFHEAMLIGEVIPEIYRYLSANPAAPERAEFTHILVDEYQDLNRAEQAIIQLLSGVAEVCIVGDDDQSIYGFKHAHPDGIRDWLLTNAGADDLSLIDCHRCPTGVVDMANALIAHNVHRPVPRALMPIAAKGPGAVSILQYPNLNREVAGIVATIQQMIASGTPAGDILVLAQSRAVGTPIYEALLAGGVPARSEYTESELEREAAQYSFALLKLFANQDDRVALRWLVGRNGNNFHAAGYKRVRDHCEATGLSPWQALSQLSAGTLSIPHTGRIVADFNALVAERNALDALPDLAAVVDALFPAGQADTRELRDIAIGLIAADPTIDAQTLVGELITAITQPEIPTDIQEVRIMSLHKSKGLSSPVTVIAGCVNGLLPRAPKNPLTPLERQHHDEEQRRLFFVGITRVKADPANGKPGTLILTYSQEMPLADAMRAGITPAYVNYGTAILQASPFIANMAPSAPAAVAVP